MYAKAHPFGYIPKKKKGLTSHDREQVQRIQTIRMKNWQTRTIKHYDSQRKGKTFAEMVYESYKV